MKNKSYILNTVLAGVVGAALLIAVLVRTFAPMIIIPALDIPNMVALSLAALVIDHYVDRGAKRCWICVAVFSAVTFALLPFAAGFVVMSYALKLGLFGGVVFTVTTLLFDSVSDRLSSGPSCKAAPVLSAVGLYLASQCFMGMMK